MRALVVNAVVLSTVVLVATGCDPWADTESHPFKLAGAHVEADCVSCHKADRVGPVPSDCESCHDRPEGHFDGDCESCHAPTAWSDFDHSSFFPTPHQGVSDCEACHTTGSDESFECIECHEHGQSPMDDVHLGQVANYEWTSNACLSCHPKGRE